MWALRNAEVIDVQNLSITEIDEKIKQSGATHLNFGNSFVVPVLPSDESGAFFGPGTEQEFTDMKREDEGMKEWYERINKL